MSQPVAQDWHRLSPRMLLVHPVHEVLRQLPVLIGSLVLGSATGNPLWTLLGVGLVVGYGLARWFTTTYRIGADEVQLRTGVLQRKVLSVPRNRIRSVSTDARLLHRLLGQGPLGPRSPAHLVGGGWGPCLGVGRGRRGGARRKIADEERDRVTRACVRTGRRCDSRAPARASSGARPVAPPTS